MNTPTTDELATRWGVLVASLLAAYESGNRERFLTAVDQLGEARERVLYRDLRTLTANLNRTLEQFRVDSRLADLAGKEMPDARVRLDHALRLTEDAAHRTLDLVERSGPLAERTAKEAGALVERLRQVRDGHPAGIGLFALLERMEQFLTAAQRDGDVVRANLAEVLMTQSYQDLCGQIIRTVITLVAELEGTLSRFAGLAGTHDPEQPAAAPSAATDSRGHGPAIPGVTKDAVGEQEDVDALLARIGI